MFNNKKRLTWYCEEDWTGLRGEGRLGEDCSLSSKEKLLDDGGGELRNKSSDATDPVSTNEKKKIVFIWWVSQKLFKVLKIINIS